MKRISTCTSRGSQPRPFATPAVELEENDAEGVDVGLLCHTSGLSAMGAEKDRWPQLDICRGGPYLVPTYLGHSGTMFWQCWNHAAVSDLVSPLFIASFGDLESTCPTWHAHTHM